MNLFDEIVKAKTLLDGIVQTTPLAESMNLSDEFDNSINDMNIMSFRSDGNVGIGITNPDSTLTITNILNQNVTPLKIIHTTPTSEGALNDPLPLIWNLKNDNF
jgi:hypothetical protein